jgi:ketosteroid isomerase-like protein
LDKGEKEEIMFTMARVLSLIALLWLIPIQSVLSEEPPSKLEVELQELLSRMDRAMVDGNFEAVLAFYSDDLVVLPNNAPKIVGKAALRKKMEDHRKLGVTFGSFMGTVERAWECGGMIYSIGSYAMSANVPGMPRPVGDKGKSFAVFRRAADGKLRIVYDMWNTDIEYGK